MSVMFDNYEREFKNISSTLNAKINLMPNTSGDEKVKAGATIEKELSEADSLVQQMDLEVRSMSGAVRSELQGRVRGYKSSLGEMKSRYNESRTAFGSAVSARDELLAGGKRSVELTAEAQGQRARLLQSTQSLGQSTTRLEQTNRIVHETEEIGSAVLLDLAQQRETLQSTRDKLRGVDTDLVRSRKILSSMARRAVANKFIMVGIILALALFIALIVYIQWFSGGGDRSSKGSQAAGAAKEGGRRLLVQLRR
ncbi:hypothetical protein KFE25_002600 [Diacronema lutheri]|uniref:Vesicle transport v-SNARE N-terminal domain-containing protein n=2 Tax=Diacronema lutheri TaxID=2081491 RepID=A0A8J6CF57_DIALT|nr:hypothetical protein KFE25_002600 [Diacronema lutheri]